jgi:hypothetical protein
LAFSATTNASIPEQVTGLFPRLRGGWRGEAFTDAGA